MTMNDSFCTSVAEQQLDPPHHGSCAPSALHDTKQEGPVHVVKGLGKAKDQRSSRELLCRQGRVQQLRRKDAVPNRPLL
jgi:hypothetical protein